MHGSTGGGLLSCRSEFWLDRVIVTTRSGASDWQWGKGAYLGLELAMDTESTSINYTALIILTYYRIGGWWWWCGGGWVPECQM